MGIRHAFISAKSDGSDPTEVQPSHWNADHVDDNDNPITAGGWTQELTLAADQTVASATLVDATGLAFAVTSGSVWRFEVEVVYSGTSTTGDFRCAFNAAGATIFGWYRFAGSDSAADAINVSTGVRVAGAVTTGSIVGGTDASGTIRTLLVEGMFRFTAATTFKFQFGQNSTAGTTTLRAGSAFRARRIV